MERVLGFCNDNIVELRKEQARIEAAGSVRYPLMKLVDMYFWQIGSEADRESGGLRAESTFRNSMTCDGQVHRVAP